jgi:hypothetical protein
MQLLQSNRDYVLLSAAGLIGTTQPGFPATIVQESNPPAGRQCYFDGD